MISNLRLQQFRSYSDASFEFEPGVNIIVGPNGSGKTNLLEALQVLATGSSYRVDTQELIQFDKEWSRLDALAHEQARVVKIVSTNGVAQKSYIFDDKPYKILTHKHLVPLVLFEPNHLQLLHGQPDNRRIYMDNLLEQLDPGFAQTRKHYRRVLAQRNALLKSTMRPNKDQLFVWNLRLGELGGAIARARSNLIAEIAQDLPLQNAEIAGADSYQVTIKYKSKLPEASYESGLLKALEQSYEQDIARGFTSYGPHRDDFEVLFDGRPASEVASRGETRTVLLALKIFELQLLEKRLGKNPVLLLDDVFSELDGKRRHALTNHLQNYQTFITTTDADVVVKTFLKNCHIIPLGT